MEINKRFLTVLTPEGEFLRARNLKENYQIGQEIDFFPLEQRKRVNDSPSHFFNPIKASLWFQPH